MNDPDIARWRAALIEAWLFVSCFAGLVLSPLWKRNHGLNYHTARLFKWGALKIGGFRLAVEGEEHLAECSPCVIVGNHQSGLDVATFGGILPRNAVGIGKKEVLLIPIFGQLFWLGGSIIIDRKNRIQAIHGLEKAADAIRQKGLSIVIFPEGTRNRTPELLQAFKKGAFHLAIDAQVPVLPIVQAPLRGLKSGAVIRMRVLPPIPTKGMTRDDVEKLRDLTRERMLEAIRGLA